MKRVLACVILMATMVLSTHAIAIDYDDCKDQVDRLRRSARDADDQTSVEDIRSALDDVDHRLRKAKLSCGYIDACTRLRGAALRHGVDAVQMLCKATDNGMPTKACMDCAAGVR